MDDRFYRETEQSDEYVLLLSADRRFCHAIQKNVWHRDFGKWGYAEAAGCIRLASNPLKEEVKALIPEGVTLLWHEE